MAKFIASVKAIITRLVFACHGFVAIWQVTTFKRNPIFWYLCCPIVLLFFEGTFTLTIKANQEWKWFCPSVFLYLGSVVPAIWLLELDRVERRLSGASGGVQSNDTLDLTNVEDLRQLQKTLGVNIRLPEIQISRETWVTLIEQFLMLILIVGRWMLPKGELTRDQLSQLLLVYIGTAADIIEFFDSFKEDKVARESLLVYLTLAIWSWSLMQFTVVLTATKSRKSRLSSGAPLRAGRPPPPTRPNSSPTSCCSIDVWAIAINMILQDAPFLAFRLILIVHYEIVSYMNIFFTCKNTLVILLQLYRLYVVQSEARARRHGGQRSRNGAGGRQRRRDADSCDLGLVSRPDSYGLNKRAKRKTSDDLATHHGRPHKRTRLKCHPETRSDDQQPTARSCDRRRQLRRQQSRRKRKRQGRRQPSPSDCSLDDYDCTDQKSRPVTGAAAAAAAAASASDVDADRVESRDVERGKHRSKRKRRGGNERPDDRRKKTNEEEEEEEDDDDDDNDDDSSEESDYTESEQEMRYDRRKRRAERD